MDSKNMSEGTKAREDPKAKGKVPRSARKADVLNTERQDLLAFCEPRSMLGTMLETSRKLELIYHEPEGYISFSL